MSFTFDRDDVDAALHDLARRLHTDNLAVTIYIVGGTAVMLTVQPDRRGTKDIDVWINTDRDTRHHVDRHIAQIAAENGWTPDWLNDNAKNFIPEAITGHTEDWTPYIRLGNVTIVLARSDVLLAMKLRAGRPIKDLPDLPPLIRAAGITTLQQAIGLFETHYPHDDIRPSAKTWLTDHLS